MRFAGWWMGVGGSMGFDGGALIRWPTRVGIAEIQVDPVARWRGLAVYRAADKGRYGV